MTLIYTSGNIFGADVEALVNTVNTVGVMGAGLAKQFKERYGTRMFDDYVEWCKTYEFGDIRVWNIFSFAPPFFIIQFPTKRHWREGSSLGLIEIGLKSLLGVISIYNIKSIAIPKLGCGLGGLNWKDVNALLKSHMNIFGVKVLVYGEDI